MEAADSSRTLARTYQNKMHNISKYYALNVFISYKAEINRLVEAT
jgi:hypothetical protein